MKAPGLQRSTNISLPVNTQVKQSPYAITGVVIGILAVLGGAIAAYYSHNLTSSLITGIGGSALVLGLFFAYRKCNKTDVVKVGKNGKPPSDNASRQSLGAFAVSNMYFKDIRCRNERTTWKFIGSADTPTRDVVEEYRERYASTVPFEELNINGQPANSYDLSIPISRWPNGDLFITFGNQDERKRMDSLSESSSSATISGSRGEEPIKVVFFNVDTDLAWTFNGSPHTPLGEILRQWRNENDPIVDFEKIWVYGKQIADSEFSTPISQYLHGKSLSGEIPIWVNKESRLEVSNFPNSDPSPVEESFSARPDSLIDVIPKAALTKKITIRCAGGKKPWSHEFPENSRIFAVVTHWILDTGSSLSVEDFLLNGENIPPKATILNYSSLNLSLREAYQYQ